MGILRAGIPGAMLGSGPVDGTTARQRGGGGLIGQEVRSEACIMSLLLLLAVVVRQSDGAFSHSWHTHVLPWGCVAVSVGIPTAQKPGSSHVARRCLIVITHDPGPSPLAHRQCPHSVAVRRSPQRSVRLGTATLRPRPLHYARPWSPFLLATDLGL